MENRDIIVIGGGACGLVVARALASGGKKVQLLEARDRIGGRIHTIHDPLWPRGTEAGAEFVHGNPKVTRAMLKEAGLSYPPVKGSFWQVMNGQWSQPEDFVEEEDVLISRLKKLKKDMSIAEFLEREFPGHEHEAMKKSLLRFVEGYDAAEASRASAIAFREEWLSEEEKQYRVKGGYSQLIDFIHGHYRAAGGITTLNSIVKRISWKKHEAEVLTADNKTYKARQVVITIPLGLWQAAPESHGTIAFSPSLPEKLKAAGQMGFGPVIKILLLFRELFWEDPAFMKGKPEKARNISFIFADSTIPTWWTQLPERVPVLTGWLAGPRVASWKNAKEEAIKEEALRSVAYIFGASNTAIEERLISARVFNWAVDPFTCGAYAYATIETNEARKILAAPVEDTLFFAGEALYEGPEMGTVEAALASGSQLAASLLNI